MKNFVEIRRGLWVDPAEVLLVASGWSDDASPYPVIFLYIRGIETETTVGQTSQSEQRFGIPLNYEEDPTLVAEEIMRTLATAEGVAIHSLGDAVMQTRREIHEVGQPSRTLS